MAAQRALGDIPIFNKTAEDFETYAERLEHYFAANGITENKKSHLITHVDHETFKLLKTQVAPDKIEDKTYTQLKQVLVEHFNPKPAIIAERFEFWQHDQKGGESVNDFAAELKRLSYKCEFGNFLNEALRDRLVCGLRDIHTQRKLLTVKDLTFQMALDTATQRKQLNRVRSGLIPVVVVQV
ncbi:uncharacterized protein [Amphiura filiformis]|uniref:uncharacterized protein n=1 Tax=Amphiura filiformis TaxID=82378 RepID=UPI003B20D91A